MNIYWPKSEAYFKFTSQLQSKYFPNHSGIVQVFSEATRATYESVWALSHFVYHKKTVWFQSGFCPVLETVLPSFYKEAYNIQNFRPEDLLDVDGFIKKMPRDLGFVYLVEDHPITGEKIDLAPVLKKLEEKRIYSVSVSYNSFRYREPYALKYHLQICHFDQNLSYALVGERLKIALPTAQYQNLDFVNIEKKVSSAKLDMDNSYEVVKKSIEQLNLGFTFLEYTNILKDRLFIYHSEANSEALVTQMQQENPQVFKTGDLISLANCSMADYRPFDGWWENRPRPDVLRGAFIVDLKTASYPEFAPALQKAFKTLPL